LVITLTRSWGDFFELRALQFLQNQKLQLLIVGRITSVPDVILEIRASDVSEVVEQTPGTQPKEQ
jgi:hypothetical protein